MKDNNKELYKLIQEGMDAERKGETNILSNVIAEIKENLNKEEIINAKSALDERQIKNRIEKGTKNIEIQLLDEIQNGMNADSLYCKFLNIYNKYNFQIQSVHTPLYKASDCKIEKITSHKAIFETCQFAQYIAETEKHNVLVVVHTAESIANMLEYGILINIKLLILKLLKQFPLIEIGLENIADFEIDLRTKTLSNTNGFIINNNNFVFSNIELVKYINHPRCGVVLDTCHALISERIFKSQQKYFNYTFDNESILKNLFIQSKPYLKLIHLNYCVNHGFGKYHSMPFRKTDKRAIKTLCRIVSYYKKYSYHTMITIETNEEDYNNAINFEETYKNLKEFLI